MYLKNYFLGYCLLCIGMLTAQNSDRYVEGPTDKIKVLNFATFHMGFTTDENKTEFNENDEKNIREVHEIARKLAAFKPTVILVETVPEYNQKLQDRYASYVKDPTKRFKNPDEVELLAYELGRIAKTQRIYGIDHKMGYNYKIAREITNTIDSLTVINFYQDPFQDVDGYTNESEKAPLLERLAQMNQDDFLDFLISINADILTHAGTDGKFEGADEAAKYYQRNLRMYSNLNRIDLKPDDRVFLLMGASHSAFFRDFISRSTKYIMVDTYSYLK